MNEDVVNKLGKGVALIGAFGWLFYWTGRWYKEWYFAQFQIPYEVLGFDYLYYIFGSWATIAVCLFSLTVIFNLGLSLRVRVSRVWVALSALVFLLSVASLVLHVPFHPCQSFFRQIVGSKDLSVMASGLVALGLTAAASLRYGEVRQTMNDLGRFLKEVRPLFWVATLIVLWASLALSGYLMGVYHGQAAIWEGKMGLRWVRSGGEWWILVVRTDEKRNFLFDRIKQITKTVADGDIEEWNGRVTRDPPGSLPCNFVADRKNE